MARNNDRGGATRRAPKDTGRRIKKKPCALCKDRVEWVDYKDVGMLRKYMSDRGKIRARRVSGNCTQHQRDVAIAIKTAREMVLLPYTQRTTTERPGGRGGGRGRGPSGRSLCPAAPARCTPTVAGCPALVLGDLGGGPADARPDLVGNDLHLRPLVPVGRLPAALLEATGHDDP